MNKPLFDLNDVQSEPSGVKVLNELPTHTNPEYSMAIIGEAPAVEEVKLRRPFVGPSGRIIRGLLGNAGVATTHVLIGNVCQYRPPRDNISALDWTGPEITEGMEQLKHDIEHTDPNLVVLLGKTAMRAAGRLESVNDWRGTLFKCVDVHSPFFGRKCMPTFHPAAVMRQWSWMPLLRFDLQRAKEEATTRELKLPERTFEIDLSPDEIIERIESIPDGTYTSIDLEGGIQSGIKCYSICTDPCAGFIVPFGKFSIDDEVRIIEASKKMFANPKIPKVLQNSLYDNFVFSWLWRAPLLNVAWDTMLSGWEVYPELPKGLATQTSIYTKEPFYKFERKMGDMRIFHEYCCKDSAVTEEIRREQNKFIKDGQRKHFEFNMKLLPIMLYMELKGMRYDSKKATELHGRTRIKLDEIQRRLNARRCKALNVNSPKQVCEFLYDEMGFPTQHPKEGNKYNRGKRTSNVDALLTLMKQFTDPILHDIHTWRKIDKIRSALEYTTDHDGRIRCAYNIVGTDTGRLTCYSSPTGSGANLQTITKKLRVLYLPDPGYIFGQFDLSGADGWTVAAHCAKHGDPTMLNDYLEGVKPAKVVALMHLHGKEVSTWSREKIREEGKDIGDTPETEWLYFACKRVQHGSNYGLGPRTMSLQILKDSDKLFGKPIYLTPTQCTALQDLYLRGRYLGVNMWQNWIKKQIMETQQLTCASGHIRRFFGRKTDNKTYQSALSHEPQANTTYATNLAMLKLWEDPENRLPDGSLVIQPLHQVHDAICVQWPEGHTDWAVRKVYQYFNNTLEIAGQEIKIPFEGECGRSWGELNKLP